jgi:uncharacterized membrane protein YccC
MAPAAKQNIAKDKPLTIEHSARTAVGAVVSLVCGTLVRTPGGLLVHITTIVVMQSTLGPTVPVSVQRLTGTALGAAIGALAGTHYPGNALVFFVCVLMVGVVFAPFRAGAQRLPICRHDYGNSNNSASARA